MRPLNDRIRNSHLSLGHLSSSCIPCTFASHRIPWRKITTVDMLLKHLSNIGIQHNEHVEHTPFNIVRNVQQIFRIPFGNAGLKIIEQSLTGQYFQSKRYNERFRYTTWIPHLIGTEEFILQMQQFPKPFNIVYIFRCTLSKGYVAHFTVATID